MQRILDEQIPLTVCPLSNTKLKVFAEMEDHNLMELLDQGLCITINADDPAYFGGYLLKNFQAVRDGLGMSREQALQLARNSFTASFLSAEEKQAHLLRLDEIAQID